MKRLSQAELHYLRNNVPIRKVIQRLLRLPSKEIEGVFRFLCPCCNEFQTSIHPNENLARCFLSNKNYNPIDLLMESQKISFLEAVDLLQKKASDLTAEHQQEQDGSLKDPSNIFAKLLQQYPHLGNPFGGD